MSGRIETEHLAVGFGDHVVVDAVDLRLEPGDALALVGSNGSGKSTLLRSLVGLLPPLSGRVDVEGRIGYLGQDHAQSFVLALRALDVVRMGRFGRLGLVRRPSAADHRAVDEAMVRTGCREFGNRPMRELSGGQRQRVRLAQVLATQADLLLVDEPTAAIDAAGREHWLEIVAQERARGAIVVSATHDIGEAARSSQVLLLAGRVVAAGPPAAVLTPAHLLATFGIALAQIDSVVVATEEPHRHDH